jgi:hypothetical protein
MLEYNPAPFFTSGSPTNASPELLESRSHCLSLRVRLHKSWYNSASGQRAVPYSEKRRAIGIMKIEYVTRIT